MMNPLIELHHLSKTFPLGKQTFSALHDINLNIEEGETLGLIGESGCGKSTLGKTILRLCEPTAGKILYRGQDLLSFSPSEMKKVRREIQMIFQNPYTSLNPRMTIKEIVEEPLTIHQLLSKKERKAHVENLLEKVGLNTEHLNRYPHEFSGGQRQRIGIARAIALEPRFIVCDEPLSALDPPTQEQILHLLKDLQSRLNLAYLFVTHDLSAAQKIANRIVVMYMGRIFELAPAEKLCRTPLHPYTQALFSAAPLPDPINERKRSRIILKGEIPSPLNLPKGCVFCSRCPHVMPICETVVPSWREAAPGHFTACHKTS